MIHALIIVILVETLLLAFMAFKLYGTKADGTINVVETDEKKTLTLEFDNDPDDLDQKKRVIFRVNTVSD